MKSYKGVHYCVGARWRWVFSFMPAVALPHRAPDAIGMEERVSTAASLDALRKREISLAANRFCYSVIVSALQHPLDLNSIPPHTSSYWPRIWLNVPQFSKMALKIMQLAEFAYSAKRSTLSFFLIYPQTVAICPKTFSNRVDSHY
jgi:hypothetical protein